MSERPIVSVIIGIPPGVDGRRAVETWTASAEGRRVEILAVHAAGSLEGTDLPGVERIEGSHHALVPELWAIGIARARGEWIALTTAHCVPEQTWIDTALSAVSSTRHAGLGGVIDTPREGAPIDWALFFARYSAYMPPAVAGVVDEIAGDNALYRASVLERVWRNRDDGFWEPLVHRAMRAEGESLAMVPELALRVGQSRAAWPHLIARFRHGRHYGSTRPGSTALRLARFLVSPLLPAILAARILRRVRGRRRNLMPRVIAVSPWLIVLLVAWSLGEAAGYLRPTVER